LGDAAFEDESPFLEQPLGAAAVICRTSRGNLHAGVLHRDDKGQAAILHLAWKDTLSVIWAEKRQDPAAPPLEWERLWAAPSSVEPERLRSVGGRCRLILKQFKSTKKMPYAFNVGRTKFSVGGQLKLGPGAKGITCAGFVLAVFESVGITLLDETTWPIRKEADRAHLEFLKPLAMARPDHFKLLQEEVEAGCRRVWPEELLASCAFPPVVRHEQLGETIDMVMAKLDSRPVQ
jgi:hypothetical protein